MVLERLEGVLKRMVVIIGKQQGLPQGILNEAGGKIFTFGSFELGVYGPRSDMDTLMVAPKHVSRENFFEYIPDLLRKEFKQEEIPNSHQFPVSAYLSSNWSFVVSPSISFFAVFNYSQCQRRRICLI